MGIQEEERQCDGDGTNGEDVCSAVDNQKLNTLHTPNSSKDKEADLLLCRVCYRAEYDRRGDAALGFLDILPPSHEISDIGRDGESTDKVPKRDVEKNVIHANDNIEPGFVEFISSEGEVFICSTDIESGSYYQQDTDWSWMYL